MGGECSLGTKQKYDFDEHVFDIIDTEEKAYWLGFLYCDGCLYDETKGASRNTLCLELKDHEHVEKFKRFLQATYPIHYSYNRKYGNTYARLSVRSEYFTRRLKQLGIVSNKTYDHSVPVYIPPEPLTKDFWRGCVDADGGMDLFATQVYPQHVNKNGVKQKRGPYLQQQCNLRLSNSNSLLLEQFKNFVGNGYICKTGSQEFRFTRLPKTVYLALYHLYNNSQIYLNRKYSKYLDVEESVKNYELKQQTCPSRGAKLVPRQVREIRQRYRNGAKPIELAPKFNVCLQTIWNVVYNHTWAEVV